MAKLIRVFHVFDRLFTAVKNLGKFLSDSDVRCLTILALQNLFKRTRNSPEADTEASGENVKAAKAS